jgi:outer membrane murein-binding lipoprotein Lpp
MTSREAESWALSVKDRVSLEAKLDALAQAIAHLASAVRQIEEDVAYIKQLRNE